jgi:hypothetical protein
MQAAALLTVCYECCCMQVGTAHTQAAWEPLEGRSCSVASHSNGQARDWQSVQLDYSHDSRYCWRGSLQGHDEAADLAVLSLRASSQLA